jgi:N-acetyl-gamma-glutamyl-phosphate reductase
MHKVGIIGASGYTGYELIKILCNHPKVKLSVLNSQSYSGKKVKDVYPEFKKDIIYTNYTIDDINKMKLDVVFLAVPHTKAMEYVPKLNCKVIDLSADYRFADPDDFKKAYGLEHKDKGTKAVYGLPELFKEKITKAKVIANPGCYATGMILSAYPIQGQSDYIVFDCKSGWSGAGKESVYAKDASILKDNLIAYKLTKHRHKYEVEQFIKTKMSFTPHVIDTFRGMMITAHILLKDKMEGDKIKELYKKFYNHSKFVKVVDEIPDIKCVQNNNMLIIGGFEVDENNQLVVIAVLDNLLKGASGQAIQNMNIILGINEEVGLE